MTTHPLKKKTDRLIHRNSEWNCSMSDCGSLSGICSVSYSGMTRSERNKRKAQKLFKDYLTKSKNVQKAFGARRTTNTAENIRRIRSVSSRIIISPPLNVNESNKKDDGVINERIQVKNSFRFIAPKRKNTSHKANDPTSRESKKSIISDFNTRSHYSEITLNSVEEWYTRFNSLMNVKGEKDENNDAIFPHTFVKQNAFSLASSEKLNFNNTNSNHRKNHFDYLKEFDLIRYGDTSVDLAKVSENERVFSLVPKISSSELVTLPRRKYSCGTLSIKDSKDVLYETEENNEKDINATTLRIEFEDTNAGCSPKESERSCFEDKECLTDTQFENDNNYVLVVKTPIRIKCTDEATKKIKDLIIYSDDFLKDILKAKGNKPSKKEIYESILKESTDCRNKHLRFITDAETYFCKQSQADIKSTAAKVSKQILSKASKRAVQVKKKSSNMPHCNKSSESSHSPEETKKETFTEQNALLKNDTANETISIKSAVISYTQTDSHIATNNMSKSIKFLKRENKKFLYTNERKPRTALKRISIENIIASGFNYYFQFYAKLGLPLKCGATISKKNSTNWLKKCGIIYDKTSKNVAEKCFISVARAKYVLNICDYIKCLNKIARNRRMLLVDILCEMMNVDLHSVKKSKVKQVENPQEKSIEQDSTTQTKLTTQSEKVAKLPNSILML